MLQRYSSVRMANELEDQPAATKDRGSNPTGDKGICIVTKCRLPVESIVS